jgi:hypothetical protein
MATPADDVEIAGDMTPRKHPDATPFPGSALDHHIEPASIFVGGDLEVPRFAPPPPVRIPATAPSVRVEVPASTTALSQDGLPLPVMGRDSRAVAAPVRSADSHSAPPLDDRPLPRLRATVYALQVEPESPTLITDTSVSAGAGADGSGFIASAEPLASGLSVPAPLVSRPSLPAAPTGEPVPTVSADSRHSTPSRPSFQESHVIHDVVVAAGAPVSVMGSASAAPPAGSLESEAMTDLSVLREVQQRHETSRRRAIRIGTVHVTVTPPPGAPAPERSRPSTPPPAAAPRSTPDFADPWLSADVVFE